MITTLIFNTRRLLIIATTALIVMVLLIANQKITYAQKKKPTGEITILAASSLVDVLPKISRVFENKNPNADITLSFGASSLIKPQLDAGIKADLVVTADTATMEQLNQEKLIKGKPKIFAYNSFVIAVEKNNPKKIKSIKDLTQKNVKTVLCAPKVPCGAYAKKILEHANLRITEPVYALDAIAAISFVVFGEADAALIYKTETVNEPKVTAVALAKNISVEYPAAIAKSAQNKRLAQAFLNFLSSQTAKKILAGSGFTNKTEP